MVLATAAYFALACGDDSKKCEECDDGNGGAGGGENNPFDCVENQATLQLLESRGLDLTASCL